MPPVEGLPIVKDQLRVLYLLKFCINDSSSKSLGPEVTNSTIYITQSIKSKIILTASDVISNEILNETFQSDSDGFSIVMAIYEFDEQFYEKLIQTILDDIVDDESFAKINKAFKNLKKNGPKIIAYCKLYKFIGRIYEHLWAFECAISIFLKDKSLVAHEVSKLQELLRGIKDCSESHLKASAIRSNIEFDF